MAMIHCGRILLFSVHSGTLQRITELGSVEHPVAFTVAELIQHIISEMASSRLLRQRFFASEDGSV